LRGGHDRKKKKETKSLNEPHSKNHKGELVRAALEKKKDGELGKRGKTTRGVLVLI